VQHDLARLTQQIRDNERIWTGFRAIEVRMISAPTLRALVGIITEDIPRFFPNVDRVTLSCFDPDFEIGRFLVQGETSPPSSVILLHEPIQIVPGMPYGRTRLGLWQAQAHATLFPGYRHRTGSVAITPLVLRGECIGSLNQVSHDPQHFNPDVATDLLEHLAAVTAICLDSAINRERLKQDGLTDPLTGVANRRFFERRLGEEVERWSRRREPLTCMMVDIDHFKQVNDRFGHSAGDAVLQHVAGFLGRGLRGVDVLARYGGEEFVLLLPNTSGRQAMKIAERLRRNIAEQPCTAVTSEPVPVTVSIGVACLKPRQSLPASAPGEWLFEQADKALYAAKAAGRNQTVHADALG